MHDIQKKLHDAFLNKISTEIPGTIGVGSGTASDAVRFYRSGYLIRIRESMNDRFHVFQKVYENYNELREKYIHDNPSTFYSLDDYGLNFSSWLKENHYTSLMSDLAYLEEKLDLFSRNNFKEDNSFVFEELNQANQIFLNGVELLQFSTPVYEVWFNEKLANAKEKECKIMVYSNQMDILVKNLNEWEFALLNTFVKGSSLASAMENIEVPSTQIEEFQSFFQFLGQNKLLKTN